MDAAKEAHLTPLTGASLQAVLLVNDSTKSLIAVEIQWRWQSAARIVEALRSHAQSLIQCCPVQYCTVQYCCTEQQPRAREGAFVEVNVHQRLRPNRG